MQAAPLFLLDTLRKHINYAAAGQLDQIVEASIIECEFPIDDDVIVNLDNAFNASPTRPPRGVIRRLMIKGEHPTRL